MHSIRIIIWIVFVISLSVLVFHYRIWILNNGFILIVLFSGLGVTYLTIMLIPGLLVKHQMQKQRPELDLECRYKQGEILLFMRTSSKRTEPIRKLEWNIAVEGRITYIDRSKPLGQINKINITRNPQLTVNNNVLAELVTVSLDEVYPGAYLNMKILFNKTQGIKVARYDGEWYWNIGGATVKEEIPARDYTQQPVTKEQW